jgi:type VI secretion system protein ImpK
MTISKLFKENIASPKGVPGLSQAAASGIRELLRDSALLVTNLTSGGKAEDYGTLRNRCKQIVQDFTSALDQRGVTRDVRDDAIVAQCALLDETALRHLDDAKKALWIAEPLQVERLNHHNAGEYVFERLEARMREPSPDIGLLECYAAVLGLGFKGRYALESDASRDVLLTRLNALLERLRPRQSETFLVERDGQRFGDWLHRLSPWALAGIATLIALVTWFLWHLALDAQLASMLTAAVKK